MSIEVVDEKLLGFYANLAILVYDNFNDIFYKEAKKKEYPYSECLYLYFRNNKTKSNTANYYINNIYWNDIYKFAINEICVEKKKVKIRK